MPAPTNLNNEGVEVCAWEAVRILSAELVIMTCLRSMARCTCTRGHKTAVLAERRDNGHIIGGRAANSTRKFDDVQAGVRTHGGVALLKLSEAPCRRQDAAEFLGQGVVPVASAGTSGTLTAVHVIATTPVFPAPAP